jgi:hypothetical protein
MSQQRHQPCDVRSVMDVLNFLEKFNYKNASERATFTMLKPILEILDKYEKIWAQQPAGKTLDRLHSLMHSFDAVADPDVNVMLGSRLAYVIAQNELAVKDCLNLIKKPRTETELDRKQVIRDRNLLRNRWIQLLRKVSLLCEEQIFITEFRAIFEAKKQQPKVLKKIVETIRLTLERTSRTEMETNIEAEEEEEDEENGHHENEDNDSAPPPSKRTCASDTKNPNLEE